MGLSFDLTSSTLIYDTRDSAEGRRRVVIVRRIVGDRSGCLYWCDGRCWYVPLFRVKTLVAHFCSVVYYISHYRCRVWLLRPHQTAGEHQRMVDRM